MKGLYQATRRFKGEWIEAVRSGAISDDISREVARGAGVHSKGGWVNNLVMWGLPATDRFMRIVANSTGKFYLRELSAKAASGNKAAIGELARLGIKGGREFTQKDLLRVSKFLADSTQFRPTIENLPAGFTTASGRSRFQFMSFMFAHKEWLQEGFRMVRTGTTAQRRSGAKRLAKYFFATAPFIGEAVNDVRAIMSGYGVMGDADAWDEKTLQEKLVQLSYSKRIPITGMNETIIWRGLQNIAVTGGIGIFMSVWEGIIRGSQYSRFTALPFVLGPAKERFIRAGEAAMREKPLEHPWEATKAAGETLIPSVIRPFITDDDDERRRSEGSR
jgi:hypothetical protein